MLNKFAVVCEWPNTKASENEFILRLKLTSERIGKECIVIASSGYILEKSDTGAYKTTSSKIKNSDVDFVINLHFASAKKYDGFSYFTLWNPVEFFIMWGYEQYSAHMVSHHDAITGLSSIAENHFNRQVKMKNTFHLKPEFVINPTNTYELTFNDSKQKIFYCGINWDRNTQNRGLSVLKFLDNKNLIHIYGPKKKNRKNAWKGYKNYLGEIPFDGISLFQTLSKYRLAICFSHTAHLNNEMITSRIFESIASGVLPIVEEASVFAKKYFGDSIFYVNTQDFENVGNQIEEIYNWTIQNPSKAKEKFDKAATIMKEKFSLNGQLEAIYANHQSRRSLIESKYLAQSENEIIDIYYIKFNKEDTLITLSENLETNIYKNVRIFIVCEEDEILANVHNAAVVYVKKSLLNKANFGKLFKHLFKEKLQKNLNTLTIFLTEDDSFFYDHISSLKRKFDEGMYIAVSNCTLDRMKTTKQMRYPLQENTFKNLYNLKLHVPLGAVMFRPAFLNEEMVELYLEMCDLSFFAKLLLLATNEKEKVGYTNFASMQVLFKKSLKRSFLQCAFIQENMYTNTTDIAVALFRDLTSNSVYKINEEKVRLTIRQKLRKILFDFKLFVKSCQNQAKI